MAIKIVQRPDDIDEPVQLPARIEVAQILRSTKASERVEIEYELPEKAGVRFDNGERIARRDETIARADTPVHHRLQLQRPSGSGALRVTIDETIRNPEGDALQSTSFNLLVR